MKIVLISLCLALFGTLYAHAEDNYRLSNNLNVNHYDIKLKDFNFQTHTFTGIVKIDLEILKEGAIEIHADKSLSLNSDGIILGSQTCGITDNNQNTQIVTLDCGKIKGVQSLTISYIGNIIDTEMYGLYKSTYGENETLIATQFEPTHARKAFPCFDEPNLKATFQITVTLDPKLGYNALSNTPLTKDSNTAAGVYAFEQTPVMSTYLIALVISKFESKSPTETGKYDYKVYARPEALSYTDTAVNYGRQLIDAMGDFTTHTYESLGISKADLISIPDFAAGAMENWGLLTYREADLLDEGKDTTAAGKQKVLTVVAHELAHQWFGDYVTLNWWNEAWLNEGFATYFEYHIADLVVENFELDKQFLIDVVQPVLLPDSILSAQALYTEEKKVNTLAEINDKFSDISYSKGGSILRMIRFVIGENAFKDSLKLYLSNNANSFVTHQLFLKSLGDEYQGKFEPWIEQSGYPLVTVKLENSQLIITQAKYSTTQSDDNIMYTWNIPITYTTSVNPNFEVPKISQWFEKAAANFMTPLSDKVDWVIVNLQQSGYYRVNYDENLWNGIITALKENPSTIHELNRAQLVDDIFNLAITGDVSYTNAFKLVDYLSKETSYYPWSSTFTVVSALLEKTGNDDIVSGIKDRLLSLMKSIVEIPSSYSTASEDDTQIDILRKTTILQYACSFGHAECIKFAKTVFSKYIENTEGINTNYRKFSLCTAIRHSSSIGNDWESLWQKYGSSERSHEKDDILYALGCSTDKATLEKYLTKSITPDSGIRRQDAQSVFRAVLNSGATGVSAALDFLIANIDDIQKYYKGMSALGDMVSRLAGKLVTKEKVKKLQTFIEDNKDIEEIKVVADQALEVANSNVKWSETHLSELEKMFPSKRDGGANGISASLGILFLSLILLFKL